MVEKVNFRHGNNSFARTRTYAPEIFSSGNQAENVYRGVRLARTERLGNR